MLCTDCRSVVTCPSCISIRQSVRMEHLISHLTNFREILWLDTLVHGACHYIVEGLRTYWTRHLLLCQFSFFFCPTSVCILLGLCVYIHMSDCVQTVYVAPLLPNDNVVKHFYTNQGRCKVLTEYLWLGRRPGGDWANTWHWAERFTVCFWNRSGQNVLQSAFEIGSSSSPQLLSHLLPYRIPRGGLY